MSTYTTTVLSLAAVAEALKGAKTCPSWGFYQSWKRYELIYKQTLDR